MAVCFEVYQQQEVCIVRPTGPLGPQEEAPLAASLMGLIGKGRKQVVIDMSAVSSVDSTTLAVLVNCWQTIRKSRGALAVASPGEAVMRVLSTTNLVGILGVCATLEEAVELVKTRPRHEDRP